MARARARRPQPPGGGDLLQRTAPEAWLSTDELARLSALERWDLAGQRRRSALLEYGRQHRTYLSDVERLFGGPRMTDRAKALIYAAQNAHPDSPELRRLVVARRLARLTGDGCDGRSKFVAGGV